MQNENSIIHKKILIVDRDYSELLAMRKALSKSGYHIMTALDILTAEKLLEVSEFDYMLINVSQLKNLSSDEKKPVLTKIKLFFDD